MVQKTSSIIFQDLNRTSTSISIHSGSSIHSYNRKPLTLLIMCLNCIILLLLCVSKAHGNFMIDDLHSPESNSITSSIISQFTKHNVIFHYDNITQPRVYPIIAEVVTNASYVMINYDSPRGILCRPIAYKFIHVVLLANYSRFQQYEHANKFPMEYADILLFIVNLEVASGKKENHTGGKFKLWMGYFLDKAGGLFILDSNNLTLYTMCFYCGKDTMKLRKITDLRQGEKNGKILVPKLRKYINKYTDFKGYRFRVGFTNYKPFFWCEVTFQNDTWIEHDIAGSEGELLYLLNSKYNARVHLIDFSNLTDAWLSIIEAVNNRSLHWAVGGITLTRGRGEHVDFTTSIQDEAFTVLYSVYEDPWMSWRNIILPFELLTWLALMFAIFIISSLLYATMQLTGYRGKIRCGYLIQGSLHFLVEQPLPIILKELRSRWTALILMTLWLSVALVMTNAYKSKLTSSLISSNADEPDSIDELVEQDFYFQTSDIDTSVLQENLGTSADSKFLEALQRSSNDSDFCTSVQKTIGHKIGIIDEETAMQYSVQEDCRKLMSIEEQQDLRMIKYELFPSQHAWAMQLGAPYRHSFNAIISRLHAAGIFIKWNSDYYSAVQKVPKSDHGLRNARPKFSLMSILGPVFIWTLGILAATLIFIGELIHGR